MKSIFLIIISLYSLTSLYADQSNPRAIFGGQREVPYAGFLRIDGSVTPINGLPATGITFRVATNSKHLSLIGGTSGINGYATYVSSKGTLTEINGLIAPGEIYTVAINKHGNGIIGGGRFTLSIPYAAVTTPNGAAISLSVPSSGLIYSAAINKYNDGIIGGIGNLNSAYAALTKENGTVTPINGLPTTGAIYWVAINDSKTKFIGGSDNASIYAAFISPIGTVKPILGLPLGLNYSVAMNESGNAIMGGISLNLPYAALVSDNGMLTTLQGLPQTPGKIYNVAINKHGTGLIAGFSATGAFGAFVSPNGTLIPLINLPAGDGFLDGAAIHSSGVAIVGGTHLNTPFMALAAPNGTLTYIDGLPPTGEINSIAISNLNNLVPKKLGIFDSLVNTQFTLSDALTDHCMMHYKNTQCNRCSNCDTTTFWLSGFGNFSHEKRKHEIPSFTNKIFGALLGIDYNGIENVCLGAGLSYAETRAHYSKDSGHASISSENAVLYVSFSSPNFYANASLWGGFFQGKNTRRSFSILSSKSSPTGWNLSPHIELDIPFTLAKCGNITFDPFLAIDWAYVRQHHFCERGRSGFNIRLNSKCASSLRSEIGVRFFETLQYGFGSLTFEEKLSYVNKTPTHKSKGSAAFIGAFSTFDVETINPYTQNQGRAQIHIECIPDGMSDTYASVDYQGGFGKFYHSHMFTVSVGRIF